MRLSSGVSVCFVGGGGLVSRMSPICSGDGWVCWAMALGGGGFMLAGCTGGTLPALLVVSTFGGAAGLLAGCTGGTLITGVWLDGGAFVAVGIGLMIKGAREFVLVARNRISLTRYAPAVSGSSPLLRAHLSPFLLALSAFSMACKKRC